MGAMEKKREELVRKLQHMIVTEGVFPGGRLPPERELASSLQVSRNLLREAIITLEAMGYIEVRERQGAFIRQPDSEAFGASLKYASLWPDDMLIYLMEMRVLIEAPIAGMAAERRTESELARMKECIRMLKAARLETDGGASKGAQWDSLLHTVIVEAAHNPLLTRLYEGMSTTMERYIIMSRQKLLALTSWPDKILEEHYAIVEAIENGQAEAASAAQKHHLESALVMLRRLSG